MTHCRRTLCLIFCQVLLVGSALPGQELAPGRWTDAERGQLTRYARATWHSFEAMAAPDGLPSDKLDKGEHGAWVRSARTSPTDIAAYLWSTIAAAKLGLIEPDAAIARARKTLDTLQGLEREHGFFLNLYDVASRRRVGVGGARKHPSRPFLSTVDNGWLAASLVMVRNTWPSLRDRADALLAPMDFGFFYEPFDRADPIHHPGQFHGGYFTDDRSFTAFYGMLNTEPRIVSYLAITRGQVPPEHYYHLFRTLPIDQGKQKLVPAGEWRTYHDVRVFEGHYDVGGAAIVPSWGGSMFEALMVPLFVPEGRWAPRSWGINHPLYVDAQVREGLQERRFGSWGFSPCQTPHRGYLTFGVPDLGSEVGGYRTFELPPAGGKDAGSAGKDPANGVVTPHASFLALAFAPHAALANLDHLERTYPIFGTEGFADSVNVTTSAVAPCVLALDQGMILAAIANALADDAMQHALADGPIEVAIRPLIAPEAFTTHDRP